MEWQKSQKDYENNTAWKAKSTIQKRWPNPQEIAYLVKLTEETINGKLHFLGSVTIGMIYQI